MFVKKFTFWGGGGSTLIRKKVYIWIFILLAPSPSLLNMDKTFPRLLGPLLHFSRQQGTVIARSDVKLWDPGNIRFQLELYCICMVLGRNNCCRQGFSNFARITCTSASLENCGSNIWMYRSSPIHDERS